MAQCAHESLRVASGLASRSVAPAKQVSDQVGGAGVAQEILTIIGWKYYIDYPL